MFRDLDFKTLATKAYNEISVSFLKFNTPTIVNCHFIFQSFYSTYRQLLYGIETDLRSRGVTRIVNRIKYYLYKKIGIKCFKPRGRVSSFFHSSCFPLSNPCGGL